MIQRVYELSGNRALYITTPNNTENLNLKLAALINESLSEDEPLFKAEIFEVRNYRAPKEMEDEYL